MPKSKSHEQFELDLTNKNPFYKDGLFWMKEDYRTSKTPILCEDKFGLLNPIPSDLLEGSQPTIKCAVNQTQYWTAQAEEVWGDVYDYDKSKYKGTKFRIGIFCKKCQRNIWQFPDNHLKGHGCNKCGRKIVAKKLGKKHSDFLKEVMGINAYYSQIIFLNEYESQLKKLLIYYKYGLLEVYPNNLLKNCEPTIKSAIDKNSYFTNQAIEVHGNKYDYSLVNYKGNKTNITIICSVHGEFPQTPSHHLHRKQGCPDCGNVRQKENPTGWDWKTWKKKGASSPNFDSFKLYFVHCWNEHESFYKVGRTFLTVEERFNNKTEMPYYFAVVKYIEGGAKYIFDLENELKRQHKQHKYIPKKKFNGMFECFSHIDENLLK